MIGQEHLRADDLRADHQYLQLLVASWGIVADFCFGDLLLFVPVMADPGDSTPVDPDAFTVHAQIRPTTNQTLYQDDLVGHVVTVAERPLLLDAWGQRRILDGQNFAITASFGARVVYIPVQRVLANGSRRRIAVLTRESAVDAGRRPGRLERVYLEVFDRLGAMIADGSFPFPLDDVDGGGEPETPRVGDGVIALDQARRVTYASPNAISGLHRLGLSVNVEGRSLRELTVDAGEIDACFSTGRPQVAEVERSAEPSRTAPGTGARVSVVFRAIPLIENSRVTAAVVLMRDVSDLRRRDRLLVTKDAAIREVHHRVKNNLQTISALLRLQGRRLGSVEAKEAIEESVRRIRSIALVHETLSRDVRDAVPFDDIVRPLVRMVEEGLVSPERPLRFSVTGELGDLPPETATPLAVVLSELLQNAVEHAFPTGTSVRRPGLIDIHLANDADGLSIDVRDNGVGLPDGFSLSSSKSLGLSIVRTLVTTELGGVIAFRNDDGAVVQLRIPREADPRRR